MRKRYLTGALVLLLVMGLSGVAFAGNTSTVIQEGPYNEAAITQTGDLNVATVTQENPYGQIITRAVVIQDNSASPIPVVGNTAEISQYVEGYAYIKQVGDGNYAYQRLDYFSEASIRQLGDNNYAKQIQTEPGTNSASAEQTGNNNSITQTQNGYDNYASAGQTGDDNSITQTQTGSENHAYAQQTGNNNSITQTQTGDLHWSQVTQNGDGNVAVVTQQVTQPI